MSGADDLHVLLDHALKGTSSFKNIALETTDEPYVMRGVHVYLKVQKLPYFRLIENHEAIDYHQRSRLYVDGLLAPAMVYEVVLRHVYWLSSLEHADMLAEKFVVKGIGMVEVEGSDVGVVHV